MQRIRSIHIGGLVGISAATMLLAMGCQDILELPTVNPTASSSSSSSTSSSGMGGMGGGSSSSSGGGNAMGCVSNTDCATPTPICDVPKTTCVECLEATDCSLKPGTVCSAGTCACPTPGQSYCRGPDRCVDLQTNSSDCGSCDHPCFGSCVAGKCADAWQPTPLKGAPSPRAGHVAIWTGSKMIVWGGDVGGTTTNTGGMLDVSGYRWEPTSMANAPSPRKNARAVWTGTTMIVWGGQDANDNALNTGSIFNPATNTWTAMGTSGFAARYGHSMVWAATKLVVWGGAAGVNIYGDGASYDVITDAWEALPTTSFVFGGRKDHSAVWTGTDKIIFGGYGSNAMTMMDSYLNDGGEYDPILQSWAAVKDGQPSPRSRHGVSWTGTEMIIWGGEDANSLLNTGARYTPKNSWIIMTTDGAPEAREFHTQEWISPRLIVWGGQRAGSVPLDTGALYDPATNTWSKKPIPGGPAARTQHSSVNASGKLVVFGGMTPGGLTNSGGILDTSGL